ncbi:VOC family protein [Pseudonocardia nantongensis]|uniref:VOC family protein n=1 Tax=Pseudonocardia nantongensis TaxID=1181885 RepID=UPI00397BECB5
MIGSGIPTFTQVAHVALVVRDMAASVAFYERVLGFEQASERREGPPEARHPRQLVRHPDSGLVLGIHEPYERSHDRFDPQRTGLDHLAVTVVGVAVVLGTDRADMARSRGIRAAGVRQVLVRWRC